MKNGILFFLLVIAQGLSAQSNIMFEKANQLYHNRYYDSAAHLYLTMIGDGYCAADLYYNAGNAFYRSNKTGLAVWSYKKALQISNDRNARENLFLAEKRISKPIKKTPEIFFIRWWNNMVNLFSLNTWAILALVFFISSLVLLTFDRILHKIRVRQFLTNFLFFLSFLSLFFLGAKYYQDKYHFHGIIIGAGAHIKLKNTAEPQPLSEGIEVEFIGQTKSGMLVELPDGRTGEIDPAAFKKL